MTLAERVQRRDNNFDVLRFLAASMVILSHSFAFVPSPPEYFYSLTHWESLATLGVCIFFTISGFLISKSWEDDPRPLAFATKRFLRIIPGLCAATLFCVFLIGPLATNLPLKSYFKNEATWNYFWTLLIFPMQFVLPGVFLTNQMHAVNGSLWTLPSEVLAYTLVAILGCLGLLKARNTPVLLLLCMYFFSENYMVSPGAPSYFASAFTMKNAQVWFSYFLVGMIYYQYREKIVLSGETCLALVLFAVATFKTPLVEVAMLAALPYTVFYVAYQALPSFHSFAKYGDFSYGLYIYAFPMQQLLAQKIKHLTWLTLFLASFAPILGVAILSWYLVERPALRLKRKCQARDNQPPTSVPEPSAPPPGYVQLAGVDQSLDRAAA